MRDVVKKMEKNEMTKKYVETKQNNLGTKTAVTTIFLILLLTLSALIIAIPTASAHDPPWDVKTYSYISVAPDPVGINEELLVLTWLSKCMPTAWGPYGDRWHGLEVEFTKPDGSKFTEGPYDTDSAGMAAFTIYPDQVGTWTAKFTFPGQTLTNENPPPPLPEGAYDPRRMEYLGDYFEPSSMETTFTVQEDPSIRWVDTPAPDADTYWTRPINAQHRNWWPISGNILMPSSRTAGYNAPFTTGPESAHILWTKELTIGGLVGGEFSSQSYHCGAAYEAKWTPPVIINGILFYNKYENDIKNHPPATYPADGIKSGYYAVDLRTGEELYYNNNTRIDFGQVYMYHSPDQHGAFAYLWKTPWTYDPDPNWHCYEAYTGDYVCTITNVPRGTRTFGPNGEILIYTLNTKQHTLTLWNNTAIPELLAGEDYYAWMWRPHGKTVDGNKGYTLNVTIPSDVKGTINHVLDDRIIVSSGLNSLIGFGTDVKEYTVYALSLKPGEEGKLLWKKTYTAPDKDMQITMTNCPASSEHGLFTVYGAETRRFYAYSTENGELLWETNPLSVWDIFYETNGLIAYDKLYATGMGGTVFAFDIETGSIEWTYNATALEAFHAKNYPLRLNIAADGKIYVGCTEHSPDDPKPRGGPFICLDAETGEELWKIKMWRDAWGGQPSIADGIIATLNTYDNRIYAIGKGQTETTVTGPDRSVSLGNKVLLKGTVTDQSPGSKDTPAISDEDMNAWMEYLHMQFTKPKDAKGVEVVLTTFDPNGNTYEIGRTTSSDRGTFGCEVDLPVPGLYKIIATFEGSGSYYSSSAETYVIVEEAAEAEDVPSAEEIADATAAKIPEYQAPEFPAYLTIDLAILIVAALSVIIGVVAYMALRKQQ
jgi:outer membrane protein assembly factor BamB